MPDTRTIRVEALSRVEGEGALHIRLKSGALDEVQLNIYEPPRFFEAFLRGRPLEEVPDITARICGICPVAYQMTSVHALESALGVQITPEIRRMRRLLYCGEWIESHALHMHFLHAPDFLGYDSGIDMAAQHPQEVKRGLRLKKHGNQLLEVLGGRAIHPVNVSVGGFYRAPRRDELAALIPDFEWGLEAAIAATRWVASLPFPDFKRPYEMVSVVHPDEYPLNEGDIGSTAGYTIPVGEYEQRFEEVHVAHSTSLQSQRIDNAAPFFVGPLARVNLCRDRLAPAARRLADELKFETPCWNPYLGIVARGLELVHAYEEALEILRDYRPFQPPRISYQYRAGSGCAATEAPRGLIYHRYRITDTGTIEFAKIVPPTSQNQKQIEDDLRAYLPAILHESDQRVAELAERLVRNYDPCISCSTHFLKVIREER
ncbi:MAG: Ni/Fe hydrogenase subunit alpha [Planctomycetes bacterium]|nr:Ni/Fe hydrogenase subunit alpha [Planctomycetota bacterium]